MRDHHEAARDISERTLAFLGLPPSKRPRRDGRGSKGHDTGNGGGSYEEREEPTAGAEEASRTGGTGRSSPRTWALRIVLQIEFEPKIM